jgi:hypothetical protein
MGATSNESKQRWNESRYTQVKFSLEPELVAAFKAMCAAEGVSMASEITRFMRMKTGCGQPAEPAAGPFGTRRKRSKEMKAVRNNIAAMLEAEQRSMDRIPESLQGGGAYEMAEQTASVLEEALAILADAY